MTTDFGKIKWRRFFVVILLASTGLGRSQPEASEDIYVISSDTKVVRRVSVLPNTNEGSPSWSPDGTRIVHGVFKESVFEALFITDINTRRSVPLAGGENGARPAWSPDGQWIAFDKIQGIYIVPAIGGAPELVRAAAFGANWSPDGQRLVFIDEDSENVSTLNISDGAETIVVGEQSAVPDFENMMASWSPDGQWITFTIYDHGIWKIAVDAQGQPTADPVQLTNGLEDNHVSWSSDSQTLVFESKRDGDFDLWTIPAAGGTATKLTPPNNATEISPSFASNSNTIAYSAVTPPFANFTRITEGQIVTDVESSLGSNWMDYDNDGRLDLFVANLNNNNYLYRNNGNGAFTRIRTGIIDIDAGGSHSSAWGDFDNDGDLDVFIANLFPNFLYENDGFGSFKKISAGAIVEDEAASMNASWADFDNDGYLDLFVANRDNQNNYLYQNNGDGAFTKITQGDIVNDGGSSFGCAWGDYDNDGDVDLFVANGGFVGDQDNFLYENKGDGSFSKITAGSVVDDGGSSFGASWGDFDNDRDLDLFVANANGQANFLYRNRGDGTFIKIIGTDIVGDSGNSSGSSWGDFDNDGDLDLFVANRGGQNNFLYENKGHGIFIRVTGGSLGNSDRDSHGSSWGDYDQDGDLDLFVANSNDQANFMFENNGHGFNWINIKCRGTVSNASAIGARVSVKATIFGEHVWQLQEISGQTGGGFGGQNSLNADFGLGDATVIDSIRIEWPSGNVQDTSAVTVNQFLTIVEDSPVQDVEAPVIVLDSISSPVSFGAPLEIAASVKDDFSISQVTLSYREGGAESFQSEQMSESAGKRRGAIPGSAVGVRGVEYRIEAVDDSGNKSASAVRSVSVRLADGHLTTNHPNGQANNSYRLISFPLNLDNPTVSSVLLDDLGPADSLKWRLWDIDPQRRDSMFPYREYPATGSLGPGKSAFLTTAEMQTLTAGAGQTVDTVEPFEIDLQPGWNMVASPFNFEIPIERVQPESLRTHLYSYEGSWSSSPATLNPWQGYMIKVSSRTTLTIDLSQDSVAGAVLAAKAVAAPEWRLRIVATVGNATDRDNLAGVMPGAAAEWDSFERFEPPPIGDFVMLSFPHRNWKQRPDIHTTDFRPPSQDGHSWEFEVATAQSNQLGVLTFENLTAIPSEFSAELIDLDLRVKRGLSAATNYAFRTTEFQHTRHFRLLVGTDDFIHTGRGDLDLIPESIQLEQNFPNPFNPVTSIRFGVPGPGRISLTIFNILGQEVTRLLDGVEMPAGRHVIVWQGRNQKGQPSPSGVYVYQLRVGSTVLSRKMVMLR